MKKILAITIMMLVAISTRGQTSDADFAKEVKSQLTVIVSNIVFNCDVEKLPRL
jgi:hypothetical protein